MKQAATVPEPLFVWWVLAWITCSPCLQLPLQVLIRRNEKVLVIMTMMHALPCHPLPNLHLEPTITLPPHYWTSPLPPQQSLATTLLCHHHTPVVKPPHQNGSVARRRRASKSTTKSLVNRFPSPLPKSVVDQEKLTLCHHPLQLPSLQTKLFPQANFNFFFNLFLFQTIAF